MILKYVVPRSSAWSHSNRWAFSLAFGWACAAVVLLLGTFVLAQSQDHPTRSKAGSGGGSVARGKYIVEGVAMCGQCHSPRESDGDPGRSHWLQGAALPWEPAKPDPNWPLTAPRIGGTPLQSGILSILLHLAAYLADPYAAQLQSAQLQSFVSPEKSVPHG